MKNLQPEQNENVINTSSSTSTHHQPTTTEMANFGKWKEELLKEKKEVPFHKKREDFLKKLTSPRTRIALFFRLISKELAKGNKIINRKQIKKDIEVCRGSEWGYFEWAVKNGYLICIRGKENEFRITDTFYKLLEENIDLIMEKS